MNWIVSGRTSDPVTRKTAKWTFTIEPLAVGSDFAGSTYRGRPQLAARIKEGFQRSVRQTTLLSAMALRTCLTHFWRFLDDQERLSELMHGAKAVKIDDLTWEELEAIWRHFINWLKSISASEMAQSYKYKINWLVHSVFIQAFELDYDHGNTRKAVLNIYIYFKYSASEMYDIEHVEFDDAKWAFRHLARAWHGILRRIDRGRDLASRADEFVPGSSGTYRWNGGYWNHAKNRLAYLLKETPFRSIARDPGHLMSQRPDRLRHDLPADLVWEEGFYQNATIDAHVACVFLRAPEIAVALAMVSMKTGLNVDTIARMPVDRWFTPDLFSPEKRVILFGPKRDGERIVRASSSRTKHTDAYRIIQRVIEIQAPLRSRMKEVAALTGDGDMARRAELIWVYPTQFGIRDILPGKSKDTIHGWLDAFFDAIAAKEKRPPFRYRLSDGRDIWALFVYFRSGFNHILTMQALGHSTIASLLHYLEKKSVIIEDKKKQIDLQNRIILDLKVGKFSPASHRPERLHKSTSGLLCSEPTKPDKDADPGNPGGRICLAQRCFACSRWYATKESLVMLSRVIMDLERLRSDIALSLWETSDYPVMLALYLHIRNKFHHSLVAKSIEEARHLPVIVQTGMFAGFARETRQ
ncbi:hypothetical protein [Bosea sp. BIWAKO-01]|uniref:hypothetical protein n=1 Tax=Bosea sp. BIWAKO-01 TaxID=506668 RepID=UPI000869174B|nr:hypothetical protein [Bosea sp. BIWAKO-01]GAU84214.1 hypothetical protein BIWAKO_04146 [Bosea sp. BIWAKO-01]